MSLAKSFAKRLWSSETFVDFDHSLNTAIKRLRQALGDEAEKPRYIETLPKRGYCFIGEVSRDEEKRESSPAVIVVDQTTEKIAATLADAALNASQESRSWSRWGFALIAVIALLTFAVSGYWSTRP